MTGVVATAWGPSLRRGVVAARVLAAMMLFWIVLVGTPPARATATEDPPSPEVTPGITIKRPSPAAPAEPEPMPFSKDLKDDKTNAATSLTGGASPLNNPGYLLFSFVVLVGVCILAYFTIKFLSRGSGTLSLRGGKRLIRFVERLILSPQKSLMIFQVASRYYLVGVTDQGMTLLAELDQAAMERELESGGQDGNTPSFSSYLAGLGLGGGKAPKAGGAPPEERRDG